MANTGFGGAIKLQGESEYRKALNQITQNLKEMSSEMKVVTSQYDASDKSLDALNDKEQVLTKTLEAQKDKLKMLKDQYASLSSAYETQAEKHQALKKEYDDEAKKLEEIGSTLGKTSKEYQDQSDKVTKLGDDLRKSGAAMEYNDTKMSEMRIQMNKAQTDINNTTKEIDKLGDETEETGKQAEKAGDGFTIFKGVVANLATSAIQAAISGIKKLGTAIFNFGKESYGSYAQYEQLVGGVETLFGDSAKEILKYAENAYKTAGISANEYLEQATSFSATLLQGLEGDTEKAVKYTDMAISDMSDNANKMGTDMQSIQNAYQGFAKDNYTMLDNLKLGYGGTAGEMARLINDSKVLGDEIEVNAKNVKDVPFNKVIEAIHTIQQQIGITGTTMKEAEGTIEGSTKSVAASWKNLMVTVASNNGDIKRGVKQVIKNVTTLAKNAIPRIKQIVKGIGEGVVTVLKQYAPKAADVVLPALKTVSDIVKSLFNFIKDNGKTIINLLSGIVAGLAAFKIASVITSLVSAFSSLFAAVKSGTAIMTALNTVMAANPAALVAAAIAGLIAVMVTYNATCQKVSEEEAELQRRVDDTCESVKDSATAWDDLRTASQKYINSEMSKVADYEVLYDELKGIADENGRIKEGYEERASYIVDTLSNALGIEIKLNDGVIQGYKDLQTEIDKTMAKKRAQIYLDSQESAYTEAINQQAEALQRLNEIQDDQKALDEERADLQKKLANYEKQAEAERARLIATGARSSGYLPSIEANIREIQKQIAQNEERTKNLKEAYSTQENLLKSYAYTIGVYEKNMALVHAERYDEMITATWNYVAELQDAANAEKAIIEEQIKTTKTNLDLLKEMREKSGSDIYDQQIAAAEKQLKRLQEDLQKYNKTAKTGLDNNKKLFKTHLEATLDEINAESHQFEEAGKGNAQGYVNGVNEKKDEAEKAGKNLLEGVKKGITDKKEQSSVLSSITTFGSNILKTFRTSLQEKSPSKATKEMGRYLLEGLGLGFEEEEKDTLDQVSSFGKSVIGTLDSELSGGSLKNIGFLANASMRRASIGSGDGEYATMVAAFKEALTQVKVELDDDEVGHFVDKTVSRLIYT